MPSSLKKSFQTALRRLLCAFRRRPTFREEETSTPDSELLASQLPTRREIDVKYYKDMLRFQILNGQTSQTALERHQVISVTLYRRHQFLASPREFLIVEVRQPDGRLRYIRIRRGFERDPMVATRKKLPGSMNEDQDLVLKALNKDLEALLHGRKAQGGALVHKLALYISKLFGGFTFQSPLGGSVSSVDVIEGSPFAISKDDICLLEKGELDASWTEVDKVQPQSLYLYQLATVAFTVQKRDFLYAALANQSFWYAEMIICIIRQMDKNARSADIFAAREELIAHNVKVYVTHKSIPSSPKARPSRFDDNTHGRKVVNMTIMNAYNVMVDRLAAGVRAEIKAFSEIMESVERNKVELTQQIHDEAVRALTETPLIKARSARADEESLKLRREVENAKVRGRALKEELEGLRSSNSKVSNGAAAQHKRNNTLLRNRAGVGMPQHGHGRT